MSKGIELTLSQIKAYENGATKFIFPIKNYGFTQYEINEFNEITCSNCGHIMYASDKHICPNCEGSMCYNNLPIQKGDKDIFVQEEFRIGYWNSKTYQMAFDYRIGKNTELKYQNVEPFNKMVEDSIKQLKAKNIKPNKYGNYKWEKFDSPLDWYSASKMTKDQSRYSFSECIDVKVIRAQDIEWVMGYHFQRFYNRCMEERNINRTYKDNDYVFSVEFKRCQD